MAANSEGAGDMNNVFYFSTAPPPPNPNPQLQHPPPYASVHHQHPQPSFSPLLGTRFPQFNPNQKQMGSTSDSCFLVPARFPLPLMRQMCDVFVMPRVEGSIGGSQSFVDRASLDCHKQVAEMALKAFNTDKKRNLKLLKVNKVNLISTNYCATFEAMEDGSGECFVLRAVVNFTTGNGVSLCEFKLVKLNKINVISTILHCPTFEAKEDGSDETFPFRALVSFTIKNMVLLCEIKDCKDTGDEMTSYVNPNWHYMCFKHERGECYYLDDDGGHRSGICDCASRSD